MTMPDRFLDRSVVHMHKPLILVLLCQRGEIAVDFVWVATVGSHLNRHMFDAEICADPGADGLQKVIGHGRVVSVDESMTGHHNQPGFDRPDMEIVDVLYAGDCLNGCSHM